MTGDLRPRAIPVPMGAVEGARPPDTLEIRGLGSCIAVAVHDPVARVAALAHAVIPRPLNRLMPGRGWAASDAVSCALDEAVALGARRSRLVARLAGGASMFSSPLKGFQVGVENARAVEAALEAHRVPVLSRDLGSTGRRTVVLDPATGEFAVTRHAPPPTSAPRPTRAAPTHPDALDELAHTLLHRAAGPLASILHRPVLVEGSAAHHLDAAGLRDFLGRGRLVAWSFSRLEWLGRSAELGVLLPDAHARALAAQVAAEAEGDVPLDDVLAEVLNLLSSHVTSGIANLVRSRVDVAPAVVGSGPAEVAVARTSAALHSEGVTLVLHGRVHAEDVLRGVDLALLVPPRLLPDDLVGRDAPAGARTRPRAPPPA